MGKVTEIITDYLPTPGDNCGITIMGLDVPMELEAPVGFGEAVVMHA